MHVQQCVHKSLFLQLIVFQQAQKINVIYYGAVNHIILSSYCVM